MAPCFTVGAWQRTPTTTTRATARSSPTSAQPSAADGIPVHARAGGLDAAGASTRPNVAVLPDRALTSGARLGTVRSMQSLRAGVIAGSRTRPPSNGARDRGPRPGMPVPGSAVALDGGSRERWALALQRTAGNQATGELARAALQREDDPSTDPNRPPDPNVTITPGGGATRQLDANPYQGENDPVTL